MWGGIHPTSPPGCPPMTIRTEFIDLFYLINEDFFLDVEATVVITNTEKVAWIWAIFFCFMAPEFFTFTHSCR